MKQGLKYHQSKKELYHFIHKNNKIRNKEVQLQTKDYHKWKKKRKYVDNDGWLETAVFSSIKRMFGEYTSLLSGFKLVKEMTMKVSFKPI